MKKKNDRITVHPVMEGPLNAFGLFTTDPQGMYTGVPVDPLEKPQQDADDL